MLLSALLDPVVGSEAGKLSKPSSAADIRQNMLNHLKPVLFVGQVHLGTALVKVRDLTDLQPGDVLLTQRKVDESMDVFVQGKRLLSAFPVICEGQYAIRVTELAGS